MDVKQQVLSWLALEVNWTYTCVFVSQTVIQVRNRADIPIIGFTVVENFKADL